MRPDALYALLEDYQDLLPEHFEVPQNVVMVKEQVLQRELQNEILILRALLTTSPEDFEQAFKKRCLERQTEGHRFISFALMPGSMSNEMYWRMAQVLFQPQTLYDMLQIIMPASHTLLSVSASESIPDRYQTREQKRAYLKHLKSNHHLIPPEILTPALDVLNEPSRYDRIHELCFAQHLVFDVNDLNGLGLGTLMQALQYIEEKFPDMYQQVVQHNTDVSVLQNDIDWYSHKGQVPAQAIEHLINGLTLGGEAFTGASYASQHANEAIGRFLMYLENLSEPVRLHLWTLETKGKTLGKLFDENIANGECVETTAHQLKRLLQDNLTDPVLHQVPALSADHLAHLLLKYGVDKKPLAIRNERNIIRHLPRELVLTTLDTIQAQTIEDLYQLIINFPPDFYMVLWEHLSIDQPQSTFKFLAKMLKKGFFNPLQKQALLKAIAKHYHRFATGETLLSWSVKTQDNLFIYQTIHDLPKKERLARVTAKNEHSETVLDWAVKHPDLLKSILRLLPKHHRIEAACVIDGMGTTLFHKAARYPASLRTLLALFPQEQQLLFIETRNAYDETVLHSAASHPISLQFLLGLYPKDKQFNAAKVKDGSNNTLLHLATDHVESMKAILKLYPKDQRLSALTAKNKYRSTVLHWAVEYPETLHFILNKCPKKQRLSAVTATDVRGNTIISLATEHLESLNIILKLLSKDPLSKKQLLSAVMADTRVLHRAARYPESFKALFNFLPDDQQVQALKIKNDDDVMVLLTTALHPDLLIDIFSRVPEPQRLMLILEKNRCRSFIHWLSNNPALLLAIFKLLPENHRLDAIRVRDQNKYSILEKIESNHELLPQLIALLPLRQRLSALYDEDDRLPTLLHRNLKHTALVKTLLCLLPEDQQLEALTRESLRYDPLIHSAVAYRRTIMAILELYLPYQHQLLALLNFKNKYGNTVLHMTNDQKTMLRLLAYYTEHERLGAIKLMNHRGYCVLHYATRHLSLLQGIISLLPEEQHFNAIMWCLMRCELNSSEIITTLLQSLPDKKRLTAVMIKNSQTSVPFWTQRPEVTQAIKESFDQKSLFYTLTQQAVAQANRKYQTYHGSEGKMHQRGPCGFFSRFRHGTRGLNSADVFVETIQQTTDASTLYDVLLTKLNDKHTAYHRHSFASYLLDELSLVLETMGKAPLLVNKENKYEKYKVMHALEKAFDLISSPSQGSNVTLNA